MAPIWSDHALAGNCVARRFRGRSTYVVSYALANKAIGPWSSVFDETTSHGGNGSGPPPLVAAFGGLGACTIAQLAGLAIHKEMPLESVEIEVELFGSSTYPDADDQIVARKTVRARGGLSTRERTMITNAAAFCPVGQYLRGTGVELTTVVEGSEPGAEPVHLHTTHAHGHEAGDLVIDDDRRPIARAVSNRVGDYSAVVTMESLIEGGGQWSILIDEGPPDGEGAGLSPVKFATAALAASALSRIDDLGSKHGFDSSAVNVCVTNSRPVAPDDDSRSSRVGAWAAGQRFVVPAEQRIRLLDPDLFSFAEQIGDAAAASPVARLFTGTPIEERVDILEGARQ